MICMFLYILQVHNTNWHASCRHCSLYYKTKQFLGENFGYPSIESHLQNLEDQQQNMKLSTLELEQNYQ